MPASCANALRPTMALLAWTASPVSAVSSWLDAKISRVSMPVSNGSRSDLHPSRHHHFLERRVAGTLADAVDRALDLTGPARECCQRVGDGQTEVVVTVRAPDHLIGARHAADHAGEEVADLVRRRVADRVRQIDRRRTGLNHTFDDAPEELRIAPGRIFGRELHVISERPRQGHRLHRPRGGNRSGSCEACARGADPTSR